MLAGLQGRQDHLAGKLARWLKGQGHTPLLVACDLQRPGAVNQLKIVGERAGVGVFAPHPGTAPDAAETEGAGPGDFGLRRRGRSCRGQGQAPDVVIVDTAGRLGIDDSDGSGLRHPRCRRPRRRCSCSTR